jgi:tRNA (cmo5U34)-methyltransferase
MKHWTFEDSTLANNFGTHVRGQLPWYDLATGLVRCIAENYLPQNGVFYDLGASDGNITRACSELIESRNVEAISVESSAAMCSTWAGCGKILNEDVLKHEFKPFDMCVCFLTLMFITPSQRLTFFNSLIETCRDGGSIVLVDKFCGNGGYADTVLRRMTLRQKLAAGESEKDILAKELSLSGIQRPLDRRFALGSQFFQIGEFHGYLITK